MEGVLYGHARLQARERKIRLRLPKSVRRALVANLSPGYSTKAVTGTSLMLEWLICGAGQAVDEAHGARNLVEW